MKRYIVYLLTIFIGIGVASAENSYPTPGEISICASTPIPDGLAPTRKAYQDIVDCGFNLVTCRGTVSFFREQFSLIGDLNLKYMIGSLDLLNDKRNSFVKAFKNDKHLAGWMFKDEPFYVDLEKLRTQYLAMKKADPNHLVWINLVGVTSEKVFTGNITSYSKYLNLIQQKFAPEVWSYDFYPILIKNGELKILYDQFYSDFEDMRNMSAKTQKPFWAYCESMAYYTNSYSRPEATEAYLRWEAFSALAYGAQGIVYWTYGLRNSGPTEHYTSALVNLDGKKTPAWYAAKKVNGEVRKFNDVFYQCNVKEIRHTGKFLYKNTKRLSGGIGPFQKIISENAGVLVSYIENKGKNYIVVVNHDVLKQQKVTFQVKPNQKVLDLPSEKNITYVGNQTFENLLSAGGYLIFQVL